MRGLAGEHQRLGLDSQPGSPLPSLSPRTLAMLRSAAGAVRKAQQRLALAQQAATAAEDAAQALSGQIDAALATRPDRELSAAIDRASSLVRSFADASRSTSDWTR